jgi:hypothetical protein
MPALDASLLREWSWGPFTGRGGVSASYASATTARRSAGEDFRSHFPGLFAAAGLGRAFGPLRLNLDGGLGAVWWIGLVEGNAITLDGAGADGPVPMPAARARLEAQHRLGGAGLLGLAIDQTVMFPTSGLGDSLDRMTTLRILLSLARPL